MFSWPDLRPIYHNPLGPARLARLETLGPRPQGREGGCHLPPVNATCTSPTSPSLPCFRDFANCPLFVTRRRLGQLKVTDGIIASPSRLSARQVGAAPPNTRPAKVTGLARSCSGAAGNRSGEAAGPMFLVFLRLYINTDLKRYLCRE